MTLFSKNILSSYYLITSSKDNYFIVYNGFSKFYVPLDNHYFKMFDIVKIEGNIINYSFNNYEGLFDFNKYLISKFIFKEIDISKVDLIYSFPFSNHKIYEVFINKLNEEGKVIVSELLFSKEYSSKYSTFISDNNLFYLLNLSSLHLYYLSYILKGILETKFKEKTVDKILVIIYGILCFFNSFKISLLRLLIYQIINMIDNIKKIELNYLKKTVISLIIIGIIDQSYFYSSSFLYHIFIPLSFIITKDSISTFKYKNQNRVRIVFLYIIIFYLSILINESFSLLSIFITPIFTLIIMILLILSLFYYLIPIRIVINFMSKGLINIFSIIDNIDLTIYISKNNHLFFVMFIILFIFVLYCLENKVKILKKISLILFVTNIIVVKLPINHISNNGVYFINVGQGDSILIHDRNVSVLVDTGGINNKDVAVDILIPFFKKKSIYHLDYVFITHDDFDHNGGFESLKKNFKILNYNKDNNFNSITINHLDFINLNPSKDNKDNNDSLVLYFKLKDISYLLLGDIDKNVEEKIVEKYPFLEVDVLKVGHHGSSTSTCDKLLSSYDINLAIISCSKNNYYGHPSNEVIERLTRYGIPLRRTDEEGTIFIKKK